MSVSSPSVPAARSAELDAAVATARSGHPVVLLLRGEAGFGKSTTVADIRRRTTGFAVLGTSATEADQEAFTTVSRLGVAVDRSAGGRYPAGFVVAQQLRERVDGLGTGPVLLWIDDAQWADPESIACVRALVERATGHPLLVVLALRPQGHPDLDEWAAHTPGVTRLDLDGLDLVTAIDLVRRVRPQLEPTAIRDLLEHTGGHPAYFATLLAEHDALALHRGRVLPAPAAFARSVVDRLQRCGDGAVALMRAVAVLGAAGWVPVYDAVEVADETGGGQPSFDPDEAAQALVDAGLVVAREVDGMTELKAANSLVRSAVHQSVPLPERRRLHLRAASVVSSPGLAIEHRASAVTRYDDELADALVVSGWEAYRSGAPRQGARQLRWASSLTRDPQRREQRRLDAIYVGVMGRDVAVRRTELATVGDAAEGPRQTAVLALEALLVGDPDKAVGILEPAVARWPADPDTIGTESIGADDRGDAGEQSVRIRLATLLAWARVGHGNSLDFLDDLAAAAARGAVDPPLVEVIGFAQSLVRVRLTGAEAELDRLAGLPRDPAMIPPELSFVLGWRGLLSLVLGLFEDARRDQQELAERVRAGVAADSSAGGILPYLATSLWSLGEWDLARVRFRLAADTGAAQVVGPLLALFALEPAGRGHTADADEWIARALLSADHWNWPEIAQNILMAQVVRLHTVGTVQQRSEVWPRLTARFPAAMRGIGLVGVPWLMFATLAASWSGDLERAQEFTRRMRTGSPRPSWTVPVAEWLTARIAEARGDLPGALATCENAVALADHPPRMHRLWMVTDLLRLRSAAGVEVDDGLAVEAEGLRRELGLAEHALRAVGPATVTGSQARPAATAAPSAPAATPVEPAATDTAPGIAGFGLSDRERDVATLVAAGLSYQQIARELFITRSTVGFHLGKIYAKAGVATRHELTALLRADPAAFGLAGTAR